MIEPVVLVRLAGYVALAVPAGAAMFACLDARFRVRPRLQMLGYAAVAILAASQLALIAGQGGAGSAGELARSAMSYAATSWTGRVLFLRIALAAASAIASGPGRGAGRRAGLAIVIANLVAMPLSGHAASAAPFLVSSIVHAVHVAAALLWSAGLLALLWTAAATPEPSRADVLKAGLRAFSPIALCLVLAAVATGLVAAGLQLGRAAALFGTAYGHLLLLKAFVFLPVALACAAALRFGFLRSAQPRSPLAVLSVEAAAVAAMAVIAAMLSQGVPGRHDDTVWPFSFRLDITRLWNNPQDAPLSLLLVAAAAVMAALAAYLGSRRDWPRALTCACGAVLLPLFSLPQAAVPATPASYAISTSRYAASNLANAAGLFHKQCAYCHGETGRGDGPVIAQFEFANADLTAAHTGDHTSGDLYWWITHGTPSGQMPDFEQDIDADSRWDLVNFVRFLTASRQSSRLGAEIEPRKPWLPSINFDYLDGDGAVRSLRDIEPVSSALLVIGREPRSLARLKALRDGEHALAGAGVVTFFVCGPEIAADCRDETGDPALKVLRSNVDDLIWAWTGYRRTRDRPDDRDAETRVGHLEFLIDRFGYVRARWRADAQSLASVNDIAGWAKDLAAEPELLPPPEQHAH